MQNLGDYILLPFFWKVKVSSKISKLHCLSVPYYYYYSLYSSVKLDKRTYRRKPSTNTTNDNNICTICLIFKVTYIIYYQAQWRTFWTHVYVRQSISQVLQSALVCMSVCHKQIHILYVLVVDLYSSAKPKEKTLKKLLLPSTFFLQNVITRET